MSLVQEGRSQKTTVTTILPVKLSFWYFQCLSSSCLCRCLCLWFCLCQLRLYWGVLCCCCLEAFGAPAVLSLSLSVSLYFPLSLSAESLLRRSMLLLHGSFWCTCCLVFVIVFVFALNFVFVSWVFVVAWKPLVGAPSAEIEFYSPPQVQSNSTFRWL